MRYAGRSNGRHLWPPHSTPPRPPATLRAAGLDPEAAAALACAAAAGSRPSAGSVPPWLAAILAAALLSLLGWPALEVHANSERLAGVKARLVGIEQNQAGLQQNQDALRQSVAALAQNQVRILEILDRQLPRSPRRAAPALGQEPADVVLSGLPGYPPGPKARFGSQSASPGKSAIRTITTT